MKFIVTYFPTIGLSFEMQEESQEAAIERMADIWRGVTGQELMPGQVAVRGEEPGTKWVDIDPDQQDTSVSLPVLCQALNALLVQARKTQSRITPDTDTIH